MVPTLEIGQRVLVNRIGARFSDPQWVMSSSSIRRPARRQDNMCGSPAATRPGVLKPTPQKADVNFIKRVVAGPGDRLSIVNGRVILNGKRQKEPFIRAVRRRARDATSRARSRFPPITTS